MSVSLRGRPQVESSRNDGREVRAARNQALFRTVNEKMRGLNEAVAALAEKFTIACECADLTCVEMIEIDPSEYEAVRGEPRQFVVRRGHIYAEIESIVREGDGYLVVEKLAVAGEVAEVLQRETKNLR